MTTTLDPAARFARAAVFDDIDRIHDAQQRRRDAVGATSARERIAKIKRLHDALLARRDEIRQALWDDYRKPAAEVDLSEIYPVLGEARHARRHLREWMEPQYVPAPIALLGSRSQIVYEPKGMALIISPWNFPVNLTLGPLVSAIAAGNCAMIKPSEMTPHASACMKRILADLFDEDEVAVVEGDATVAEALLKKRFDHIFFTGSPNVGRIVMHAAAEHLTSVTLELGGKSPVIVDRSANLDEAAKKVAWGKFFNAGQICIAPDYVLVDESVRAPFVEKLRRAIDNLGGDASRGVLVNERHAARVRRMIGSTSSDRALPPTIVEQPAADSALMREEIFGPVLPVLPYCTLDDALRIIAEREKPLALYLFSRDRRVQRDVLLRTRAGGTAINDTLLHFYQLNLPFGGVGNSGVGKGHGRFGFEAFSNARGVFEQPTRFSMIQLLYPPYTRLKQKLIDLTLRYF
ncbi:MAG TPA: aldehyde dehydrogenase family protein [Thermoanaerobaculia bacterium]|nr:aldehyde dehydrogenase family protein [Thermoanaerobaculia bacterium]